MTGLTPEQRAYYRAKFAKVYAALPPPPPEHIREMARLMYLGHRRLAEAEQNRKAS